MNTRVQLVVVEQEPRVDSRLISDQLGVEHESAHKLIKQYQADFEEFGILRFEIGEIKGRGQPQKFALLNEDQAYLLLTYSQNTTHARELKKRLVRTFGDYRRKLAASNQFPPAPIKKPIRSRADLSFTRWDERGAIGHWVVPSSHDPNGDWCEALAIGKSYFAEVVELAQHNIMEARAAVRFALSGEWQPMPGGLSEWRGGGQGIEHGFATAIADALFPPLPAPEGQRLPGRKARG